MPLSEPTFFIRGDDGEDYGPVDLEELREWVVENRAGLGTTVRLNEPGALWQPWQYYPELVALLAETRATGGTAYPAPVAASIGRRVGAFLLDLILAYILIFPVLFDILVLGTPQLFIQLVITSSEGQYTPVQLPAVYNLIIGTIVYGGLALYMAGFHFAHGMTPGKALMRLRVVDQAGEKPRASQALIRGLVLSFSLGILVSFYVGLCFIPLIYAMLNPQRRALHDLVAGTYVIEV